jgi:hypothetical protein
MDFNETKHHHCIKRETEQCSDKHQQKIMSGFKMKKVLTSVFNERPLLKKMREMAKYFTVISGFSGPGKENWMQI